MRNYAECTCTAVAEGGRADANVPEKGRRRSEISNCFPGGEARSGRHLDNIPVEISRHIARCLFICQGSTEYEGTTSVLTWEPVFYPDGS